MSQLFEAGALRTMDVQFRLSRLRRAVERLSPDAVLAPNEAYLHASFYISADPPPESVCIVVEGKPGDLGHLDTLVSRDASQVTCRASVDGRWCVKGSGDAALHHSWAVSCEFAIDIIGVNAHMRNLTGDGTRFSDDVTCGQPILAAADGVVVATRTDRVDGGAMLCRPGEAFEADQQRVMQTQQAIFLQSGLEGAVGNHVLIRLGDGEPSFSAHLKLASVRVEVGQSVAAGVQIAQAGGSGDATEPHLHFRLNDGADLNLARGLPVAFSDLRPEWAPVAGRHLRSGDILEHVDLSTFRAQRMLHGRAGVMTVCVHARPERPLWKLHALELTGGRNRKGMLGREALGSSIASVKSADRSSPAHGAACRLLGCVFPNERPERMTRTIGPNDRPERSNGRPGRQAP